MKTFHIEKPDENLRPSIIDKINNLTKPKGSLGRLEEIALQIALIQQTLTPALHKPVTERSDLATTEQFPSWRGRRQLPLPTAWFRTENRRRRRGL